MSLINEALKKAQRAHHERAASASAGADPGGPIVKRTQPKSARSTLLIVVGAVALVVVSIALTAFWLSGPKSSHAAVAAKSATATPSAPAVAATAAPIVVVPPLTPPSSAPKAPTEEATAPTAPTAKKSSSAASTAVAPTTTVPAATTPATNTPLPQTPLPATTVAAAPPVAEPVGKSESTPTAKPDERIHQYVEALRVTGIRSSGTESKVLMNDRVYRVNDIVDRTLGIRLTKVAPDNLTFTDSNGVTYVKYF